MENSFDPYSKQQALCECSLCPRKFSKHYLLRKHIREVHPPSLTETPMSPPPQTSQPQPSIHLFASDSTDNPVEYSVDVDWFLYPKLSTLALDNAILHSQATYGLLEFLNGPRYIVRIQNTDEMSHLQPIRYEDIAPTRPNANGSFNLPIHAVIRQEIKQNGEQPGKIMF